MNWVRGGLRRREPVRVHGETAPRLWGLQASLLQNIEMPKKRIHIVKRLYSASHEKGAWVVIIIKRCDTPKSRNVWGDVDLAFFLLPPKSHQKKKN